MIHMIIGTIQQESVSQVSYHLRCVQDGLFDGLIDCWIEMQIKC